MHITWLSLCKYTNSSKQCIRKTFLLLEIGSFILIRSKKMQQYAGIYLLQNHSTCSGCPSHPSSGVHKAVTAASGTGHSIWATTFLQHGLSATLEEGCCSDTVTCTRGCSYSFMYSRWVRWTSETCRVILQYINTCILLHLVESY